jgi:hypothetical protein
MTDQITISKTLSIRDCGYDEDWLQEQIAAKPSIIGLGDLVFVEREKRQLSGGKLDILLKTRDGETVFEVEVMLGETNGDHIIRTIEYWDLEERQDKKRTHFPVLIAEDVTRRFFNVINRFSPSIPIIAIKANIVEVEGKKSLHFTTILNAFEDSETDSRRQTGTTSYEVVDESFWKNTAPWTLSHAIQLEKIVSPVIGRLASTFHKDAIRLRYNGEVFFRLNKRNIRYEAKKTAFYTWLKNEVKPATTALLDKNHVPYTLKRYDAKWQTLRFEIEQDFIDENPGIFRKIAELVKKSWQN